MKTPLQVVLTLVGYWLAVYGVILVPRFLENYHFNLIWLTLVIPNMFRFIVGNIPRLAVDRGFFLSSTVIALILTYITNKIWKRTGESIKKHENDKRRAFELSALLATNFTIGVLISYFLGVDKSIYSNMGWETPKSMNTLNVID